MDMFGERFNLQEVFKFPLVLIPCERSLRRNSDFTDASETMSQFCYENFD